MARYLLLCCAIAVGMAVSGSADDARLTSNDENEDVADGTQQRPEEMISIQTIETESEEALQVKIADVVFTTSHLSFQHADGSETVVRPMNGKVRMEGGRHTLTTTRIRTALDRGIFSHESPTSPDEWLSELLLRTLEDLRETLPSE